VGNVSGKELKGIEVKVKEDMMVEKREMESEVVTDNLFL